MTKKRENNWASEEAPKYVTRFIENNFLGRIVTTHLDGHYLRRVIGKIMEPTPRTGNTIPGNQM